MKVMKIVAVVAFAALVGVSCGGGDDAEPEGGGDDAGAAASVTLTASDFSFEPTDLTVAAGGTIEYTNEDDVEHNFTAEEADLDEDVDPMGSTTIDLGDVEPGTYDFVCEYHPEDMTGTLEVTE